jgi:phosphatidylglycerol---prolipoprotein diacylglyceryl transferase
MLQIGPFNIQSAGLILLLSVSCGMMVAEKLATNSVITQNQISDGLFWGLGGWIILARLGYSFAAPDVLLQNPLNLVSLNIYQFDAFSGLVGFLLTIGIYSSRKDIPFRFLLDVLIPFFLCVYTGYVLSTFASGEIYGSPASIPWGITIWSTTRHPFQFYELLTILFAGLTFIKLRSGLKNGIPPGCNFLVILAILVAGQIIIIPFRGDPGITSIQGIRLEQITAWIILTGVILILGKWLQPLQSEQEKTS